MAVWRIGIASGMSFARFSSAPEFCGEPIHIRDDFLSLDIRRQQPIWKKAKVTVYLMYNFHSESKPSKSRNERTALQIENNSKSVSKPLANNAMTIRAIHGRR